MELPHLWQPVFRVDLSGVLSGWFESELGCELLVAEN